MTQIGQFSGLALLLLAAMLLSLSLGNYPMAIADILHFFSALIGLGAMDAGQYDLLYNILVDVRLPRVLAAVSVGMALSGSGAAFQAVFRNPLVSPGMLGVLAGASFGATLGMLIHGSWLIIQTSAMLFGLLAVVLGVVIGMIFGRGSIITLLLGGIISSALFSALLSMVKFVADPQDELPSIIYWLMGSLGLTSLTDVLWLLPPMLAAVVVLCGFGRALDAMSMGDDEAKALGVPVLWVRYGVIIAATMASALSVSIAGIVGWVGLLTPHVARMLVGPGNTKLMPVSIMLGAIFLLLADCLARVISQVEIPIGIVTECLGLPLFLLVLHRARKGWN